MIDKAQDGCSPYSFFKFDSKPIYIVGNDDTEQHQEFDRSPMVKLAIEKDVIDKFAMIDKD